ncbi:MAG: tRNA1(Val) (adenine(37)-N6)-methyltransferase [Phreatobacter sp.]|jgi:tRNA1(Val) A37 N6-methylase TrmN6|uniref:tRNA1(Val) (adenine(37)-N6)-methyltransferase n=1 Tax=Phreatobacter sp. TaxID=1966341 RepID=UPI004035FE57
MTLLDDPLFEPTADRILGGRVAITQPRTGHRAGHDAVLLAAAVPASPGDRILDLGAGVGAAAFCLAARVPQCFLTLVEIDPGLAALAEQNAAANGFGNRTRVIVMDAMVRGAPREKTALLVGEIDRVITNPPFHDAPRHRPSPGAAKRLAHTGGDELLSGFLRKAVCVLRPGGTVTLIHRADRPDALLAAMKGRFGGITVRPVHPRPGAAAVRLIVTGTKGSRAPISILPGLVLLDSQGQPTPEAEAILREGQGL